MTERKNKAYFDKIRRSNPSEYFSQRVQLELYRQAMKQGKKFYETAPTATPSREPVDAPETDFNDEDFEGENE